MKWYSDRVGSPGFQLPPMFKTKLPTGYTLFGATPNTQTIRPHLARVNTLDPVKDFTPLTSLAEPTIVIVANPAFPPNNLKDLIEYAKANPGKLSYATSGIGSSHHLSERRSTEWPEVGIVSEAVPGFEKPSSWTGLLGPGAMAPALARRIAADVVKTMNEPKTKARIEGADFTVRGNTPEEFAAQLRRETELVGRIVKTAGIQPTE